jgi:hypothetical protein
MQSESENRGSRDPIIGRVRASPAARMHGMEQGAIAAGTRDEWALRHVAATQSPGRLAPLRHHTQSATGALGMVGATGIEPVTPPV